MRKAVLVVLLAACGDDGVRHTPDATPHDGPVTHDAAPDAPGNPVAISTTLNGQAVGGVHVYFQNADSSVVLATVTDAAGNASAVMQPGGYVTAINPYTPPAVGRTNDEVDTFVGVKPGDHLKLAMHNSSVGISFTLKVPIDTNQSASLYSAFSPCNGQAGLTSAGSGAAPSGTMYLYNCGTTTDFLVVSYDQTNTPVDFFFATNVAVADQTPVDLTARTYADMASTRTYNYQNAGNLSLNYTDTLLDVASPVYQVGGGIGAAVVSTTSAVPAFAGANDLLITQTYDNMDLQSFVDWGPYTATFSTDLGPRLLPTITTAPSFDPTTNHFTFAEAATGATPDFVVGSVDAFRTADARGWTWRIAAPHATSLTYPTLPTDVYDYNITANDGPTNFQLAFGTVPGGYDAVRPFLLSQSGLPTPDEFALGGSGAATIEQFALPFRGAQRQGDTMGHAPRPTPRVLSHRLR